MLKQTNAKENENKNLKKRRSQESFIDTVSSSSLLDSVEAAAIITSLSSAA